MKAMEVLPILKEKVAYLSGTVIFSCCIVRNCHISCIQNGTLNTITIIVKITEK